MSELKLPKTIKIGRINYDIVMVDDQRLVHPDPGADATGCFDPANQEIRLLKSMKKGHLLHVFFHEIVHALTFTIAFNELYENEQFTDLMADAILSMIEENDLGFLKKNNE